MVHGGRGGKSEAVPEGPMRKGMRKGPMRGRELEARRAGQPEACSKRD